jgi:glutamyl-tRNA synthetase
MPQWVHLPLILKPDGHGKLSKRDGDRLGFPVYAQNWTDPKTGDLTKGFKELGFMPEAFVNLLAMLGWNDGTDREIFTMEELIQSFSIERISKAGAKFDFEKAKWYNHEWIKNASAVHLLPFVKHEFSNKGIELEDDDFTLQVIDMVKDRCNLLTDFISQSSYFFVAPLTYDLAAVKGKWSTQKEDFFQAYLQKFGSLSTAQEMEETFKTLAAEHSLKPGELMLPFRIMLVGGKFGPGVFDIARSIGTEGTKQRVLSALIAFQS